MTFDVDLFGSAYNYSITSPYKQESLNFGVNILIKQPQVRALTVKDPGSCQLSVDTNANMLVGRTLCLG